MSTVIELSELYRSGINVWVEDSLTSNYLTTVWGADPNISFLVGGGKDWVGAAVKNARVNGSSNVFGVIDRDFRESNRADWLNTAKDPAVFVPTVHELENFCLDPAALEGCDVNNLNRTRPEIQAMLEARARKLCWWMACREVVASYAADFRNNFIKHPPANIPNAAAAELHVCNSRWFTSFQDKVPTVTRDEVVNRLQEAHQRAEARVNSGEWTSEFSGKELFRDVRSRIYDSSDRPVSQSELDADVAKSVAQWQLANGSVPAELTELRTALRMRVGL